jgi:hypothetical protein
MLRKTVVVLVIALGLGSSGLSTSAFARGLGGGGVGSDHWASGFGGRRDGAERGGVSGLHRATHGNGRHDVWGHWGAYYGPMIPPI